MKQCFSCQQGANKTVLSSLELHKRIFDTTGKVFWFFKEEKGGKVKIADNESFNIIKERIKGNKGAEWSHIAEFGRTVNDNVLENITVKRPKTVKSKRKPGTTGKPLEKDI